MKPWRQDLFGSVIWTEDSFQAIAVEPQHWDGQATTLWNAARIVQSKADEPATGTEQVENANLAVVAMMLRSMSIECQLKAIHFHRRIQEEGGSVSKVERKKHTHDVLALAVEELSYRSIPLSKEQTRRLERMHKMIVSNRYHVDTRDGQESITQMGGVGPHADEDLRLLFDGVRQMQLRESRTPGP